MKSHAIIAPVFLLLLVFVMSCAGMTPLTSPDTTVPQYYSQGPGDNHQLMGLWQVVLYEDRAIVSDITPRSGALTHFNIKNFLKNVCDDCLSFSNFSHDEENQVISADVTLRNPTAIEGADVRGIVMSNNPEIYLLNPDDYTKLWDQDDPPDINPFRLFGKDLTDGIVEGGAEVTEHYELHYDELPALFQTAVDVIYPTDALREPYEISNQTIDGELDTSGMISRQVDVDVFDRHDDVGTVTVVNEELGIESVLIRESDTEHYYGTIANTTDSPGEHFLRIEAADSVTPWVLYDYLTITVTEQVGEWQTRMYIVEDSECVRDLGTGIDAVSGFGAIFTGGGEFCDNLVSMNIDFTAPSLYFDLNDIDPIVPGFNPFPIYRTDASLAGGNAFFADSDETYSDEFYVGPVSSLMVTIYPTTGAPQYTNNGDGDASRMYPSDPSLKGVDITDDIMGNLYGLWADPDGVLPPEIYGLEPDFTRHDVLMGGVLPEELVGDGPGKISPDWSNLRGLEVTEFNLDTGTFIVLESDGVDSEIEFIDFAVDLLYKTTTFSSAGTIDIRGVDAVDTEAYLVNPMYSPNPEQNSVAVLVQGSTGGYLKMYKATDFSFIEDIGSDTEPLIPGNVVCVEVIDETWSILIANDAGEAAAVEWTI